MAQLVALSAEQHQSLYLNKHAESQFAASQHLLTLRVNEVGQAISSFPTFLMKDPHSGLWRLAAITSFVMGSNLFVQDNEWQAAFKPSALQTFPFFLMKVDEQQGQDQKANYTVGIDPTSAAFSADAGEEIFTSSGKASMHLSKVTAMLEADIQHDIHTYQFGQLLHELGLIKPINIVIYRQDGSEGGSSQETLQGLCTIDEDKFNTLPVEQLESLRAKGYLLPINALLLSIYQLNNLIRRNNDDPAMTKIEQIKLAVNAGS